MNIAIIGRTEILYNTATFLHEKGYKIKLIITAKEAPEYTKKAEDFKILANKLGCEYLYTSKINEKKNIEIIKKCNIDIGISINYPNIISQEVINLFPYGILNSHGGDLPKYRGNACQAWAIINGEDKIGLCIHKMVGGELDSGDIISRRYLGIDHNTKIGYIADWITRETPQLFLEAISKLGENKDYILEKQSQDPNKALRCYPRKPEDGKIDWYKSDIEILRLINACNKPYDGAFCTYKGEKLIIWNAELYDDNENYLAIPGQISYINNEEKYCVIISGKGKLKINQVEYLQKICTPNEIFKSIRDRVI